jgi:hypothetical protein
MAGRGRSVLRDRSVHALRNSIIDGSRIKTLAEATRSSEVTPTTKQAGEATVREERRTGQAISHGVLLAVCCLLSYKIITVLLTVSRFVPRDDELLGGMWAVVATIFVFRYSCEESMRAALSRTSATLLSFALCLVYLLVFPFRVWGLVVLIAVGAIVLDLIGRSEDMITACITTAVVLVDTSAPTGPTSQSSAELFC